MSARNPKNGEPANQAQRLERRAKAVALKARGATLDQIAQQLGYSHRGNVSRDIQAALLQSKQDVDDNLVALRRMQDIRYDDLRRKLHAVLASDHVVTQHGQIVRDADGRPVRDHMPVLQAVDRILKLEHEYNILHGLNADERMVVAFENRSDVESAHVVEALLAAFSAVEVTPDVRRRALEAAQSKLAELAAPVVDAEVIDELEG